MKFIEATSFFVRTISFDFINRDEDIKLKFRLIPMVHIGTPQFYEEVTENLNECDEVLYEGCDVKGINIYSKLYGRLAKKLDLVKQSEHLDLRKVDAKFIHSDYNKETGKNAWRKLRLLEKLKMLILEPIELLFYSQFLTREILTKSFMTGAEENYLAYGSVDDEEGTVENLILNDREQIIFQHIRQKIELESQDDKLIGILYGAGHMKKISRFLIDQMNFVGRNGKFMKVYDV